MAARAARYLRAAVVAAATLAAAAAALAVFVVMLGPAPSGEDLAFSPAVVDRDGRLLRPYATPDGRWRLRTTVDGVDPRFVALLLACEDKRFPNHPGVDPLALARAAGQLLSHGRIVSGGSTLTMQVARLLEPRAERSFVAKLRQIVRAAELERRLTKAGILNLYLVLAPYGGNVEGVRAAALAWFGKEPRRLSAAEAALLVALPQSPEARRPDRSGDAARRARDRVLDRALAAHVFDPDEIARARTEAVPLVRTAMPMLAPHASDAAVLAAPAAATAAEVALAIDGRWQASLEMLARERAHALGPGISVAIVAADNATGEVLARVGSADWSDASRAGQVDMTIALRSPGSTLKPFIYGLGFEDGIIHPDTLIDDRPVRFGHYKPENFDLQFHGTVAVREALQMSLNVPAVEVLDRVGAGRFAARLRQAGGTLVLPTGEAPGLAMGLGGTGVRLSDLVMLYAGIARLGTTVALLERPRGDAGAAPPRRLMDPVAAYYVASILRGVPPPENAPGGRIAFKTGTSYGYRDAWSIGFDGRRTIGVWVGRPDGAPVPGLTGHSAAAPILFAAFARSGRALTPLPPAPNGAVSASNAKLPPPLRRFRRPGSEAGDPTGGDPPPRFMFPPDGARVELTADDDGATDPVALRVAGGVSPLTVFVNGVPLADTPPTDTREGRTFLFKPDGPGFARLTVMDARGQADSVTVRLQ